MCSWYFIDFENVRMNFLELLSELQQDDKLLIFTMNDDSISIPLDNCIDIIHRKIDLRRIVCHKGKAKKNAMDFQLATLLGAKIQQFTTDKFVIVSNDTGFDPVVQFWSDKNVDIKRLK